jgi:alkanesulfonate monooxygenase SsuD/methylene tetrahydromethanopterin reductase-like flavin-dependent oxidoreductase (luciferase family)
MKPSFGIFDHVDKQSHQALGRTYADRLRVLEVADKAGFYSYHLAEHHGTPLCMAPSPSVFLAALTQRTTSLRLGPLVYLLPLYHPLRLIEEVCMLDHLSGGRLDLGVGRGISPIELSFLNVNPAETPERFKEELEILLLGLRGTERLTFHGRFHHLENVPIEFVPVQKPHPPIWYPTSTADRVPWVAERGFSTVLQGGAARVRPRVDRYWEVWHAHHAANAPRPRLGVMRTIFLADHENDALRLARPAFRQHYNSLIKLWREHGLQTAAESFTDDLDEEIRDDKAYIGSVDQVRDQVAHFFETTGSEYLVTRLMFGDLPVERVLHSLELFVHEVMPAFAGAAAPSGARSS